ncbi:MAG: hypothetical protein ACP5QO_03560 [Clostridia bacterium]
MRAMREILRLYFDLHLTYRGIEQALQVSHGTVAQVIQRFQAAEAVWPLGPDVDEAHLERWLYPGNLGRPKTRPEPDWARVHQELRRTAACHAPAALARISAGAPGRVPIYPVL